MTNIITLTLVKSLIIESVKNETFFTGIVDKSVDSVKNAALAYHEQAGDDEYQERLIERALFSAIEELKTHLSDYLSTSGYTSADNSIDSSQDGDNIIIRLVVGDRFNKGYTQSLARLSAKYVEESILIDWWKPVNEKQCALYASFLEKDLAAIRRCFNKTAPVVPVVPYTTVIDTVYSSVELEKGEEATVTYTISAGSVDDIECRVEDSTLVDVGRSEQGFTLTGRQLGHTYIELYSRHDSSLTRTIHVYVTDHS